MTLNSVRHHNCFITQSNYIGYMFRLLISHPQAYFNGFNHQMLYTHWDPSVYMLGYQCVHSTTVLLHKVIT